MLHETLWAGACCRDSVDERWAHAQVRTHAIAAVRDGDWRVALGAAACGEVLSNAVCIVRTRREATGRGFTVSPANRAVPIHVHRVDPSTTQPLNPSTPQLLLFPKECGSCFRLPHARIETLRLPILPTRFWRFVFFMFLEPLNPSTPQPLNRRAAPNLPVGRRDQIVSKPTHA